VTRPLTAADGRPSSPDGRLVTVTRPFVTMTMMSDGWAARRGEQAALLIGQPDASRERALRHAEQVGTKSPASMEARRTRQCALRRGSSQARRYPVGHASAKSGARE
jgi:hypothetical protein